MKDYDHVVVWTDYFNKHLPRSKGRRLARDKCVFDPVLKELIDAVGTAGIKMAKSNDRARFPRRPYVRVGYVLLPKEQSKSRILDRIARRMVAARAKRAKQN